MTNRHLYAGSLALGVAFAVLGLLAAPARAQQSLSFTPDVLLNAGQSNSAVLFDDPVAIYEGARIVHNVTVNKVKGMRVHAKFRVKHGLDVSCSLIAYFYYDTANNTPLRSSDANYRDAKGNVSAHSDFTPAFDPAVYEDLQLFVPYGALNLEKGREFQLKFYLSLYDKEGERFFGKSGWYKFTLTMP